jgi:hypothetical protein
MTLTPTMRAALKSLLAQTLAGEGDDLSVSGIRQPTLLALRDRGFVKLVDFHTYRVSSRKGPSKWITTYRVIASGRLASCAK